MVQGMCLLFVSIIVQSISAFYLKERFLGDEEIIEHIVVSKFTRYLLAKMSSRLTDWNEKKNM